MDGNNLHTQAIPLAHSPINFESLIEPPDMIYNASPFVEHNIFPNVDPQLSDACPKAARTLKNGCVEYLDERTGQKTRIAGLKTFALMTSLEDLYDQSSGDEYDPELLASLLSQAADAYQPSLDKEDRVLNSIAVDNTQDLYNIEQMSSHCHLLSHKRRYGENASPYFESEGGGVDEVYMLNYLNYHVINQEAAQRRQSSRGYCGSSEKVRVELGSLDDGYKWRKYGRKTVKGNTYPRSYFKCTFPNCVCRKQVEQNPKNPTTFIVTYEGRHIHPPLFVA